MNSPDVKKYHSSTLRMLTKKQQATLKEMFTICSQQFQEISQDQATEADDLYSLLSENVDGLEKYLKLYQNSIETDWQTNKKLIAKEHSFGLYITDVIFLIHFLLLELLTTYLGPNPRKKISKRITKQQSASFSYMTLSYHNIIFSLHESRQNILEGKELAGDVLFRHFMEMFESTVLVLVDEEYFSLIKDLPKDKKTASQRWNQIKPKAVKRRLDLHIDKYFTEVALNEGIKIVRDTLYHNSSKSAHGDFHVMFASNFKCKAENGEKSFNPFGYDGSTTSSYFENFIVYNYNMIFVLFTAFISHNRLPFKFFGKIGEEVGVVFKYFEALMKSYLGHRFKIAKPKS